MKRIRLLVHLLSKYFTK